MNNMNEFIDSLVYLIWLRRCELLSSAARRGERSARRLRRRRRRRRRLLHLLRVCGSDDGARGHRRAVLLHLPDDPALYGAPLLHDAGGGRHADARAHGGPQVGAAAVVAAWRRTHSVLLELRSVEEEEKAFALGIQFVIFRIFGYIPSPILFGNVIDSTCLLWKSTCEG